MLAVTNAAAKRFERILDEAGLSASTMIRLTAGQRSLQMGFDYPRPGDRVLSRDGRKVLLYDDLVAELLGNKTIDLEERKADAALVVT